MHTLKTMNLILFTAASVATLTGCDVFLGGRAREQPVIVERREVVEQRPVIVEQRREVIVAPAPAPLIDVQVH